MGKNINPVWSPDGRQLVWVSDRTGTNDLYLYERAEQRLYRISDVLSGVIAIGPLSPVLSWAGDGRLLFAYFEQAGYNIYGLDDPRALPRVPASGIGRPIIAAAPPSEPLATPAATTGGTIVEPRADPYVASYYRSGNSFRPSRQAPAPETVVAPVSVVALLDSAALALPDTLDFEHTDYKVKFTPDMIGRPTIGAQVGGHYGNGLYGGSFIALSDMLGNHNILAAANVNGSLSDASFYSGYSFLKTRTNFGAAFYQQPLYRYYGVDVVNVDVDGQLHEAIANVFIRDLIRGGQLSISYPFSTFRRVELGASAVHYTRDILYRGIDRFTGEPIQEDDRLGGLKYLQPQAALVFDNSRFGWTGPVYGRRYRLQLSRTFGDLKFTEGLLDFRNYWNYKQKVVLAGRFVGLTRFGGDADQFSLYWGGPYYIRGYDGGSFDINGQECSESRHYSGEESISRCPVRDQLIGSSAAFMNLEMRVPVITELQIGFLGNFPPVDAVAFFDGGIAWDNEICMAADLASTNRCATGEKVHVVWDRKPGQ
ncbi:MAG: hypothetical protein ACRELX_14480, partial [Longimicrobiales bacterium]